MMKLPFILVLVFISGYCLGQKQYVKYYHENGNLASEGYLIDGKPDSLWINYFEDGTIRSRGERKNFKLEGAWYFYNPDESLKETIQFSDNERHGLSIRYYSDSIVYIPYENGLIDGYIKVFNRDDILMYQKPFVKGVEHGIMHFFDTDPRIIQIVEYNLGMVTRREIINQYDKEGFRHGSWMWFHENGSIHLRGWYREGKRNGYFREFSNDGKLIGLSFYVDDQLVDEDDLLVDADIRYVYHENKQIKLVQTFRNNVPHGLFREFDEEGNLFRAGFYDKGLLKSEGILNESGNKTDLWKMYYSSGVLSGLGVYFNDIPSGKWTFYYENGAIEQVGNYDEHGYPDGTWIYYFENGLVRKVEYFNNGKLDGEFSEFDLQGKLISQGLYIDDQREYSWQFQPNGWKKTGEFQFGDHHGTWMHIRPNGNIKFKGSFVDGLMHDQQIFYHFNGKISEKGRYVMGKKYGIWEKYDENGVLLLRLEYKDDRIVKIDNMKVNFD
jgi:uncharacterized protein